MKHRAWKLPIVALFSMALSTMSFSQIPDLLTSFDAGGSALGMGGSLQATSFDTLSAYFNPAGLGFMTKRQFGLNYRNLPQSSTVSSGTLAPAGRLTSTVGQSGDRAVSHMGIAMPLSDFMRKGGGVIGFSYAVGGFIEDSQFSPSLFVNNALNVNNYHLNRSARSDYYTLAYGRANTDQTLSFGVAFNYVRQQVSFAEFGTFSDNSGGFGDPAAVSDEGHGFCATVGVQGVPKNAPNTSWGISYRSPVQLQANPNTSSVFSRIPARALAGVALRNDNIRGGKDFVVLGAQVGYFFDGKSSVYFDRSANQTTASVGLEYNSVRGSGRIPIRVGYASVPSGGTGFAARNAVTYGIGYRPDSSKYSFDLNFAAPQGGGFDTSIGFNYRFEK